MKPLNIHHIAITVLAMVSTILLQTSQAPAQENAPEVRFRWAFGAIPAGDGERRLASVTGDAVLHSGDRFKFFIQPETDCYVYLFYRSVQGEMALLFPETLDRFERGGRVGEAHYVPPGKDWFSLDEETGLERFYLLAATDRLTGLERLYRRYMSAATAEKQNLSAAMVEEIRQIRRSRRRLSANAERPVSIGGNLRGEAALEAEEYPDVAVLAATVAEDEFFARTFTIDHR